MRLTVNQVKALPLDLRACYQLQPWGGDITIHSLWEWADQVGWVIFFDTDKGSPRPAEQQEAADKAARKATDLYVFLLEILIERGAAV
jgi:hypothetical protein